ncbi:MAG: hypothetical protein IJ083_01385 [Clostridia bacterium]|nr:hypothetical protein [Clostridia bacterium]
MMYDQQEIVLGFDTSCYTTSCSAVSLDGKVIGNYRKLLPVPAGERGLRQSEAVFHHVRQLPRLVEQMGQDIRGKKIAGVCASSRPRDEEDSYMPVFQVGDAQARAIASVLGVPSFSSTHQRGHIAAARIDSGLTSKDFLTFHISGGTTELLQMKDDVLTLVAHTGDLHAGQLVDRAGVAMGLPFPAGPNLEKLALRGHAKQRLGISVGRRDQSRGEICHFSGAETQILSWIRGGEPKEDVAAEIYDLLARTFACMIDEAERKSGTGDVLLCGGVSSSILLRSLLEERVKKLNKYVRLYFGHPEYSSDNAVGQAMIARQYVLKGF